jgi:hypothetical protein
MYRTSLPTDDATICWGWFSFNRHILIVSPQLAQSHPHFLFLDKRKICGGCNWQATN